VVVLDNLIHQERRRPQAAVERRLNQVLMELPILEVAVELLVIIMMAVMEAQESLF
jgi:hypothetical protein